MAFMKFYTGSEANAQSYLDGIYLATDTHKLFYKGSPYGGDPYTELDWIQDFKSGSGTMEEAAFNKLKDAVDNYKLLVVSCSGAAHSTRVCTPEIGDDGSYICKFTDINNYENAEEYILAVKIASVNPSTRAITMLHDTTYPLGGSEVDLSNYYTIAQVDGKIGTNVYTGANYISKETNLTDAVLQLDVEIKATNDNLALEHTNAEATYAKKTELGKKLDISTYTSDKATFALKSEIPDVSNFLTISNAQSTYLTKTDAKNIYQPKGSYLTSVSIATISDLNANWDALLKSNPSGHVTRWPNMSEVGSKQNLVIKLNGGTTEGTNQFTYNVTARKSINITPSSIGAAASSHNHNASQVSGLSKVATSGSYNDLTNKPTIPSAYTLPKATTSTLGGIKVGDGLEITGDGTLNCIIDPGSGSVSWGNIQGKPSVFATNIASINDLNSGWDALLKAAPNIPSLDGYAKFSDLVSIYLSKTEASETYQPKGNYLTSVSWSQVSGKPSWIGSSKPSYTWSEIGSKPTFATVATSGSYNDLTNKPTIPSLTGYATQSWVNSQGFVKGSFLPLTGGTLSGDLIRSNSGDVKRAKINNLEISVYDSINTTCKAIMSCTSNYGVLEVGNNLNNKNVHIDANTGITLKGTGVGISLSTGGSSSKFFATDGSVQTIDVDSFALKSTTDTLMAIANSQDKKISNMKLGMARYTSGTTAQIIKGDEGTVGLSGTPALYFYNGGIVTNTVPVKNCIRVKDAQCYVDENGIYFAFPTVSTEANGIMASKDKQYLNWVVNSQFSTTIGMDEPNLLNLTKVSSAANYVKTHLSTFIVNNTSADLDVIQVLQGFIVGDNVHLKLAISIQDTESQVYTVKPQSSNNVVATAISSNNDYKAIVDLWFIVNNLTFAMDRKYVLDY